MQTRQVVALVVIAAIIALALGVSIGYGLSASRTTTYTATGSNLYEVEFIQEAATCPPSIPMYVAPWSVTLGNQNKTEPSNGTGYGAGWSSSYGVYSKISFLVHNGVYNYNATPDDNGYTPFQVSSPADPNGAYPYVTGTVTVSGSNVSVNVGPAEVYCSAASESNSTTSTTQTEYNGTYGGVSEVITFQNGSLEINASSFWSTRLTAVPSCCGRGFTLDGTLTFTQPSVVGLLNTSSFSELVPPYNFSSLPSGLWFNMSSGKVALNVNETQFSKILENDTSPFYLVFVNLSGNQDNVTEITQVAFTYYAPI